MIIPLFQINRQDFDRGNHIPLPIDTISLFTFFGERQEFKGKRKSRPGLGVIRFEQKDSQARASRNT